MHFCIRVNLIQNWKIIITKERVYANSSEKRNNKPTADQICSNFKTYFTAAQIDYKKSRPNNTAKSNGYQNQANIVEGFLYEIDKCQQPES